MYPVTRPRIPDLARYARHLERVNESGWLTNFGPLHEELTARLEEFLGVENLLLVSNGTLALQVAYRTLGLSGAVFTTPFSFVATTATLAWERLDPIFVDVDRDSFNLSPTRLAEDESKASGIVAVHVYGNPCEVEELGRIGRERGVPVIYDGAHAFGSTYRGESLLRWGDAATLSFHATKIFHTVEGGAIVFRRRDDFERARALINFGLARNGRTDGIGLNAKLSEYNAAVGLVLLEDTDRVLAHRAELTALYRNALDSWVEFQSWHLAGVEHGAYMPVLLESEDRCVGLHEALATRGINTRRYFHPSLNRYAAYGSGAACPVGESISDRVLCLPLYADLARSDVLAIAEDVKACLATLPAG